jgi:hypothetical protein
MVAMLHFVRQFANAWKQMHLPSTERRCFEKCLQVRPASTDAQWISVYEMANREFVRRVLALVEQEAQWPVNKLVPNDPLRVLFHGKSDEDLPFARFKVDIRREFGVDLSCDHLFQSLEVPDQTLGSLITLIWTAKSSGLKNLTDAK